MKIYFVTCLQSFAKDYRCGSNDIYTDYYNNTNINIHVTTVDKEKAIEEAKILLNQDLPRGYRGDPDILVVIVIKVKDGKYIGGEGLSHCKRVFEQTRKIELIND